MATCACAWAGAVQAQQTAPTASPPDATQVRAGEGGRGFFVSGWLQYSQYLNESGLDMGVRLPRGDSGFVGGVPVNASGRVEGEVIAGYRLELGPIRELFVLYQPDLAMGNEGSDYPLSLRPIVRVTRFGAGVTLPRGWRLYAIHNRSNVLRDGAIGEPDGGLNNFVFVRTPELVRDHGQTRLRVQAEAGIAPYHNEYALGIIYPTPTVDGYGDNFGRYWLKARASVEHPQALWIVEKLLARLRIEAILGRNTPQVNYTMSARPIGEQFTFAAGVAIRGGIEIRLERSFWVLNDDDPDLVGIGPQGPYWAIVLSSPVFDWRP